MGRGAALRYFPVRENWRRIRPHLADPRLQRVLARDMARFSPRFRPGMKPFEVDGCDWRFFDGAAGRRRFGITPSTVVAIGW